MIFPEMSSDVQYFPNIQAMSQAVADRLLAIAEASVKRRSKFTLALSGGSTPRTLYECLARDPYASAMPWPHTHLFWGDERYVPADHPDSNFLMVSQALLAHIPIPALNVNRINTDLSSPEETVAAYERDLRRLFDIFGSLTPQNDFPVFDVILLGLGKDGHTASLFPNSPALQEMRRWVVATPVPELEPRVPRLTLTFPVINAARHVFFLVAGADKQPIVNIILHDPATAWSRYPAARVSPAGTLTWCLVKT